MQALTLRNLVVLASFTALLSACAQSQHVASRYGSGGEIVTSCCAVAPPPCGVYTPCAPPLILRPAPPVIQYIPSPAPITETPVYVPPAPVPEPEIYIPEPTPVYDPPVYEPPVYTPPVEAWPEPASPPPVWVPRK